ncbi:MAG: TetR/AcrR family transcriptional regulator [Solirubrobacteraceae bacterium]
MATSDVSRTPLNADGGASARGARGGTRAPKGTERYRPLPTGTHGLHPELVKRDQRNRLQKAMVELIEAKGYPAVRIVDLAKLAHVSQPTFYSLYADKEGLFLSAYEEVAQRTAKTVIDAYAADGSAHERLRLAIRAFASLAAREPETTSLLVLGAFGAGARARERRRLAIAALERAIQAMRDGDTRAQPTDLTLKFVLGGIREVTAARLREGRAQELPEIAEELAAWAGCYPRRVPPALEAPPASPEDSPGAGAPPASERARRAEGRLPSGRSDLPRQFVVKSQRERIVDATAAIVAEQGLAALTIPEITRRANVSNQTFYDIYSSKHEAFLGAQKVGMHQALGIAVQAYEAQGEDWARAVDAGARALLEYLASEPAHAHLTLVDTFAACPEAIEIRNAGVSAFVSYLRPGYALSGASGEVPAIAAEAVAGGIWQVLHHYIENDCLGGLIGAAPQLTYFALSPFLGTARAAEVARGRSTD